MSVISKIIDLVASYIEMFIIFEIYTELFIKNRRVENIQRRKLIVTFLGTALVFICNQISVFSYFIPFKKSKAFILHFRSFHAK